MKKLCVLAFLAFAPLVFARGSLGDTLGIIEPLCEGGVDGIIETIGTIGGGLGQIPGVPEGVDDLVNGVQSLNLNEIINVLCEATNVVRRVENIYLSAEDGLSAFLGTALDEGFGALRQYAGIETDLTGLQNALSGAVEVIENGDFSIASLQRIAGDTALINRLNSLLEPSAAPEGSASALVDEMGAVNPGLLAKEIETGGQVTNLLGQMGETSDTAMTSMELALDAMSRGDELTLLTNVTNPVPGIAPLGTAEIAQRRGQRSVSTRAAVQALVDAQGSFMRQQALETTTVLTGIKEMTLQQALSTQQLSAVANALYSEQIQKANEWRQEYMAEVEEGIRKSEELSSMIDGYADMLGLISENLQ